MTLYIEIKMKITKTTEYIWAWEGERYGDGSNKQEGPFSIVAHLKSISELKWKI